MKTAFVKLAVAGFAVVAMGSVAKAQSFRSERHAPQGQQSFGMGQRPSWQQSPSYTPSNGNWGMYPSYPSTGGYCPPSYPPSWPPKHDGPVWGQPSGGYPPPYGGCYPTGGCTPSQNSGPVWGQPSGGYPPPYGSCYPTGGCTPSKNNGPVWGQPGGGYQGPSQVPSGSGYGGQPSGYGGQSSGYGGQGGKQLRVSR